jgi:glycosyltransferase involved in cell wall biosynthesis
MRISAVMPTYNRRNALAQCLSTLSDQDLPAEDYELVVVVDGSDDGTVESLFSGSRSSLARAFKLLPQRRPRNLAVGIARQFRHEHKFARALVGTEAGTTMGNQSSFSQIA